MTRRPHYEGDPRLLRVMVRPRWVAALLLALAVAGGFAWLGQWQLGHAITTEIQDAEQSEIPRPIDSLTAAGTPVSDEAAGMVVSMSGEFVQGDLSVVEQRENGGVLGVWVTGHFAVDGNPGGHLAAAIGWAPTRAEALQAIDGLEAGGALTGETLELEGRYMPSDAPVVPEGTDDPMRVSSMAPAQLINLWAEFDGPAYAGYLVVHPSPEIVTALQSTGLSVIDSVAPLPVDTVNWLNLFYAVEWVVFAGFAVFFWYRLARDAWEREHELQLEAAGEAVADTDAESPKTPERLPADGQ